MTKDEIGPAAWALMHQRAAQFPEEPAVGDKIQFRVFLRQLIRSLGCGSCMGHASLYLQRNPPDMSSRKSVFKWTCDFHNEVRRKQGKREMNCFRMLDNHRGDNCPSCKISHVEDVKDVSESMEKYKGAVLEVLRELAKEEGVDLPDTYFQACPSDGSTSCHRRYDDGRVEMYLNPYKMLRIALHEFKHHVNKKKGLPDDEESVERWVQEKIAREFPKDHAATVYDSYESSKKYTDVYDSFERAPKPRANRGILSHFDRYLGTPLANITGLSPQQITDAHVPEIFGNLILLGTESSLSPFGQLVASSFLGLAMMGAGVGARSSMVDGDRILLNEVGAHLIWNGIRYANPKISPQVLAGAKDAGIALAALNPNALLSALTGTPSPTPTAQSGAATPSAGQAAGPSQYSAGPQASSMRMSTMNSERAPDSSTSNTIPMGSTPTARQSGTVRFH